MVTWCRGRYRSRPRQLPSKSRPIPPSRRFVRHGPYRAGHPALGRWRRGGVRGHVLSWTSLEKIGGVEASLAGRQTLPVMADEREAPEAAFALHGDEEPAMRGDVIAWSDLETFVAIGEQVAAEEPNAPMCGNASEPVLFRSSRPPGERPLAPDARVRRDHFVRVSNVDVARTWASAMKRVQMSAQVARDGVSTATHAIQP